MPKAVILDTSAIMYRAHFALMGMKNSKGKSTGATYRFINTLNGIIKEFKRFYKQNVNYKFHSRNIHDMQLIIQMKIDRTINRYKIPVKAGD